MPDITMCRNDQCPMKMNCYRHQAIPNKWQSYTYYSPDARGHCEAMWPVEKEETPSETKGRDDE